MVRFNVFCMILFKDILRRSNNAPYLKLRRKKKFLLRKKKMKKNKNLLNPLHIQAMKKTSS